MAAAEHTSFPTYRGIGMQSTRVGDDRVIALEGELELATATGIGEELRRAEAEECARVVVDLRSLEFLDSTGINLLVMAHGRCVSRGRDFVVLVPGEGPVRRVLDVCGVLGMLQAVEDEAIAA